MFLCVPDLAIENAAFTISHSYQISTHIRTQINLIKIVIPSGHDGCLTFHCRSLGNFSEILNIESGDHVNAQNRQLFNGSPCGSLHRVNKFKTIIYKQNEEERKMARKWHVCQSPVNDR